MLQAKELMIGDWVFYTPTKIKNPVRIGKIYVNEVRSIGEINFYGNLGNDCISEICFEPIPLTPEILEKNGFIRHVYGYSLKDFKLLGNLDENDLVYFTLSINGKEVIINYIYQLQHALRLCDIDKEITL